MPGCCQPHAQLAHPVELASPHLLDVRIGDGGGFIYNGFYGTTWASGVLCKNGCAAQTPSWTNTNATNTLHYCFICLRAVHTHRWRYHNNTLNQVAALAGCTPHTASSCLEEALLQLASGVSHGGESARNWCGQQRCVPDCATHGARPASCLALALGDTTPALSRTEINAQS